MIINRQTNFIFLLAFFPLMLYGQLKISGTLMDRNQHPLSYLTVLLLNTDSTVIHSNMSDSLGNFSIEAVPGVHIFQISQMGIHLYEKNIDITDSQDLGRIVINIKENLLEEVEITAKKPLIERKIDRLVFNVEQAVIASGGTALDALRITPNIQLKDNGIEIIGKSGVRVMINERPVNLHGEALINYLASLRNDDIKSIEVISNPGAKYDAEGTGGLINIVLKQALPESWNANLFSTFKQATYGSANYGGSFNYKENSSTLSFNGSYNHGSIQRHERDRLFYTDQIWDTDFNKRLYTKSISLRAAYDFAPSKKLSVGIEYMGSYSRPHGKETDLGYLRNTSTLLTDSLINTDAKNERQQNSSSINGYAIYRVDTLGKTVYLTADYFHYNSRINRSFTTESLRPDFSPIQGSLISTLNEGDQRVRNYSGKIDFDWPTKWVNLSFGTKLTETKTDNTLNFYHLTPDGREINIEQSNQFLYNETMQAVYFSGNRSFGTKWETQFGLRVENTQIKGNSITYQEINRNSYVQLFPTIYMLYRPDRANSLSLEYGRRINRPRFSALNPFRFYSSPYNYTEGNPFLTPQYATTLDARYDYKHFLYATISFLKETDGFGEVPFADDLTKTQYFTQLNYFTYDKYSFSLNYIFDKLKWWICDSEAYLFYNRASFNKDVRYSQNAGWGTYFSTINTFNINNSQNLRSGFHLFYRSSVPDLLFNNHSYWNIDLFFRYAIRRNKLLLSMQFSDVFRTYKLGKSTSTNDVYQVYSSYNDNHSLRLSLSYNFGNTNIKSNRSKSGNSEEKNRVN